MLVLTRKKTESIRIGSDIEIRILGVSGGRVRVGINAPAEVPVHRGEVAARIDEFLLDTPASPQSLSGGLVAAVAAPSVPPMTLAGFHRRAR